jgi:hypothetical protein
MFHGTMAALLVVRLLDDRKRAGTLSRSTGVAWRTAVMVFLPLGMATLFACQGRTVMLKSVALAVLGFASSAPRRALGTLLVAGAVIAAAAPYFRASIEQGEVVPESQAEQAVARLATLRSQETWTSARQGAWPAMVQLAGFTWNGIGLSRVGAASDPWIDEIKADPHFGQDWSFADNLWRCLFTEIGIGGLLAFLLLVFGVLLQLVGCRHYVGMLTALYSVLVLIAGFGSEAILYNPDAAMFWFNAAFALRYAPPGRPT